MKLFPFSQRLMPLRSFRLLYGMTEWRYTKTDTVCYAVYRRIGLHRQILYPQPRRVRLFYQLRLLEAVDNVQIYRPLCQGLGTACRTVITSKSFSPYPCAPSLLQTHRKESFNIDNIECLSSWIIWNNVFFENLYVFAVLFPDNYSYLCREYQQQLNIFSYLRTTFQLT